MKLRIGSYVQSRFLVFFSCTYAQIKFLFSYIHSHCIFPVVLLLACWCPSFHLNRKFVFTLKVALCVYFFATTVLVLFFLLSIFLSVALLYQNRKPRSRDGATTRKTLENIQSVWHTRDCQRERCGWTGNSSGELLGMILVQGFAVVGCKLKSQD